MVVAFHGGGRAIADKTVYDGGARRIAKAANAIVVSVDDRRAPETELPAAKSDLEDPRLDLVQANPKGLCRPVTISNAQSDPLRTAGFLPAAALRRAKVPVEQKVFPGFTHEFFGTAAVVQRAKDAQDFAGSRSSAALAPSG